MEKGHGPLRNGAVAGAVATHGEDVTRAGHAERYALPGSATGLRARRWERQSCAPRAGIGRATLYRHFTDVEAVLTASHERQIAEHLQQLADVRDRTGDVGDRLAAVLAAYAGLSRHRHGGEAAARLHGCEHVAAARARLRAFFADLIAEAARAGEVRADVPAEDLADHALGALSAASGAATAAAVHRLVTVTLTGLRGT